MSENSKNGSVLLKIAIVQFILIFVCFILLNIFGISFSRTVYAYSKLPKDIETYSEAERIKEIKKIENEFKTEKNIDSIKFEDIFYKSIFKESPSLLLINNFLWFLAFIVPALILFKFILKDKQNDLTDELDLSKIFLGIKVAFAIFLFLILVSLFFKLIQFEPKTGRFQKELFSNLKGNHYLLAWTMYSVGIITGILEELFFRGFLLNQYIKNGYKYEGLLITSSVFGALHYTDDSSILVPIMITLVGFVLGGAYIHTKNIWVSISAHATYNSLILVTAFLFGDTFIK